MTPYVADSKATTTTNEGGGDEQRSMMVSGGEIEPVASGEAGREGSLGSREDSSIVSGNGKPKHTALKRVSFGSSKGSMVETMVYDYDVVAPYRPLPHIVCPTSAITREEQVRLTPPAKVRVTFYESQKPHYVTTPDSSEFSFNLFTLSATMASPADVQKFISMNMGAENPFRPDGELSREAESLVRQVQTGQPLTPSTPIEEILVERSMVSPNMTSPTSCINGGQKTPSPPLPPATVEVQHGIVVPPASPSNVEQVVIKKKPKCHCCVIL